VDRVDDEELREMVRASIARIAGGRVTDTAAAPPHASFARLPVVRSGDDQGNCLIEPSVRCNHCGYCLSYGH
jgi:hypothetical protein